jgi:hypothetical protein
VDPHEFFVDVGERDEVREEGLDLGDVVDE